jgi:transposase
MAGARRSARAFGKSDPIDASAVARAALREPNLPQAQLAGPERDVGLLVSHREDLVAERTRIQNRLRWVLHDLDPALEVPPRALKRYRWLTRVRDWLRLREPTVQVRVATRLVARCEELSAEVNDLEAEISELVRLLVPELLALPGCGALTAAKIVAETAGASRFRTDAQFAMHAGVAPLEASSGGRSRHRLNRTGNRQLNAALHRLAVNQGRLHEPARIYLCRRQSEGLSRREALRCLKRHLARIVFNILRDKEAMTVSPQSMIATIGAATA